MQYNAWYRQLLRINPRYHYIYTALLCSLLILLWLFLWYMPIRRQVIHLDQEMNLHKKNGEQYIEQQEACKKMMKDIDTMHNDISAIYTVVTSQGSLPAQPIAGFVREAHMHLLSIRKENIKDASQYQSESIILQAIGTFDAIRAFFSLLQESALLIQCDDLSMQRQADNTYLMQATLRAVRPKKIDSLEEKSPSTLKS